MLSNLPHHYTALVTGASGGIGTAIIKQLLTSSNVGHIIAVSRRQPPHIDDPRLTHLILDVSQEQGRQALQNELTAQPIHFFSMLLASFMVKLSNCFPKSALMS